MKTRNQKNKNGASPPLPDRALILAAGFGTRLRPLTHVLPKPLAPVWSVPVLEHHLQLLKHQGIRNVIINLHYNAGSIIRYLTSREPDELNVSLSFEPEILGTGGALKKARWFFGDEDFWMLNADVAADLDLACLLKAHRKVNPLSTCWMIPDRGPRTVEVCNNVVHTFRSKTPGAENTFTFSGIHLISPRIWQYLPNRSFCSIIEAYENGMNSQECIAGVCCNDSFWADLGTPDQLLDAHQRIYAAHQQQQAGKQLYRKPVTASLNRQASGEIHTGHSVLCAGGRIHPGANLKHAIVGPDAHVYRAAEGIVLPAAQTLPKQICTWLTGHSIPVQQCSAQFLKERGSERSFIRLESADTSWMLILYNRERTENRKLAPHTAWLKKAGVNVPDVFAHHARNGWILMEDAGIYALQEAVRNASKKKQKELYRKVLNEVILLHTHGLTVGKTMRTAALMPPFKRTLFEFEHDLFNVWYLKKLCNAPAPVRKRFETAREKIIQELTGQPSVLLHRDLQSSNILLKKGHPVFIDYQGMRKGPAVYDMASLLADPYVVLDESLQEYCISYYEKETGSQIQDVFWWAVMQRMIQAIGAYARISLSTQNQSFLAYIPGAQHMIRRALSHIQLRTFPEEVLS